VSSPGQTIDQLKLRMPSATPRRSVSGRSSAATVFAAAVYRSFSQWSWDARAPRYHLHAANICRSIPLSSWDVRAPRCHLHATNIRRSIPPSSWDVRAPRCHLHATNIRRSIPPSSWDASELSGGPAGTGVEEAFWPFSPWRECSRLPFCLAHSRPSNGLNAVDRRWPPNGGLRANAVRATGMDVLVTRVATSLSGRRRRALGRPLHGDGV
jgi:hypothetical protein